MKNKYLQSCQIETPEYIARGMWRIAGTYAKNFSQVVDFGAGDARFSHSTMFDHYTGFEIDPSKIPAADQLPKNVDIINTDAFSSSNSEYDLCIGNPPYIRANRLDPEWRNNVAERLKSESGVDLNKSVNLFAYFLMLALLRTKSDGLVIQLIPFEWVSRPSAKPIRDFIARQGWQVHVYRFNEDIFDNVLTTASVTVIDKSKKDSKWRYYQLSKNFDAVEMLQPSGTPHQVLEYSKRHTDAHSLRGLSPGSQGIFTLTEHERLFYGLNMNDVVGCITSLKNIPIKINILTTKVFKQYYVDTGQKCWLIRSDKEVISPNLRAYLDSIDDSVWKKYTTCTNRAVWWKYTIFPCAPLLVASGFVNFGPKVLLNSAKVIAVGSVYGVFAKKSKLVPLLADGLRKKNFEIQVVSHSNNLKKLEIRQLNSVLSEILDDQIAKEQENNVSQESKRIQYGP